MSASTRAMSAESRLGVAVDIMLETDVPDRLDPAVELQKGNLADALDFFKTLEPTTSTRGNIKLHLAVDQVVKHSMAHGLEPQQITDVLDVILNPRHKLSQAVRSKFVKCLIPASGVPQDDVIRVVSEISTKIFTSPGPSNLHSLLLRWILLVFDYIDGYDQLHKVYNIIFTFLNSHRLLPHACHLLFLLTRKDDVRIFRVSRLLELTKTVGPEPYIMGVLMIYKVYCPHLVTMRLNYGHKVFFKAHDTTWRSTIASIMKLKENEREQDSGRASQIKSRRERAKIEPRCKRQRLMVPAPHSAADEIDEESHVSERMPDSAGNIPYTQIESFTGFLEAIDRIEYPSQVAACLTEPRLQLLLTCNPDPLVMTRLCFWIQHVFTFGFRASEKDCKERNEKLLHMLYNFSSNVQGLPVILGFLESFLPTWDGQSYAPLIFSLISCVQACSYDDLYPSILEPLQRLYFSLDVYGKTMCVTALTRLIENFSLEDKSRSQYESERTSTGEERESTTETVRTGNEDETVTRRSEESVWVQSQGKSSGTIDTIYRLINFLDAVLVVGMRMENDHYLLQSAGLDLLQLVSELCQKYNIPLVCLPMRLIQRLLLSDCPATLARLCGIINLFREAFTTLKSEVTRGEGLSLTCDTVSQTSGRPESTGTEKFNSLLLDVLGMLWQGRMFSDRKHKYKSMFKFPLPLHLQGRLRGNELSVYRGPAFQGLAYKFLKETQREDKRIHPDQIEEFKEVYLQFLTRENFPEFMELVNTNIKRRKMRT